MRKEQLLRSQVAINRELEVLFTRIGDVVKASAADAAAAGAETILRQSEGLLKNVLSPADYDYLKRSAQQSASQSLEVLRQRISGSSYVPLAESVWSNQRWANSTVNSMVNSALARGASAAELAKEVRAFVNPSTPGGVRYASLRLARTELNNAFHAAQVKQAQEEPWVVGVKWHLSGSHPVPDECNTYAESTHTKDGEAGVFKKEEVPAKPHPNCLCYTTPVTPSSEEFIDSFMSGDYDDYLEERGVEPDPPKPRLFGDLRQEKPESYSDALKVANPVHTRKEYLNNCHWVVNAMEMRARGYKVVASPTFRDTGRYLHSIQKDWVDPATGKTRKFTSVYLPISPPKVGGRQSPVVRGGGRAATPTIKDVIVERTADWPQGARGFVQGEWTRGGGAHIFSVYKTETGVLRFVDGQVAKGDVSSYLDRMKAVKIMRVDDLEPVETRVRDSVKTKSVGITPEVELERARVLLGQLMADAGDSGSSLFGLYMRDAEALRKKIKTLEKKVG
jgi:hypothetical protein